MRNFIQRGETITATAPAGGILSGDAILIENIFGVATFSAAEGDPVEITTLGVFELPKAAEAMSWGTALYWDSTNSNVTTTASGNSLIGGAVEAVSSSATSIRVRLNGVTV